MTLKAIFAGLAGAWLFGAALACSSGGGSSSEVPGLAAAAKTIGFPADCESCINDKCAAEFEACWPVESCMKTEICTGKCIETGQAPGPTCATSICPSDAGIVTNLNECLIANCSICQPSN